MMGKLRKEFVFQLYLWQYIVTLEHGTYLHMHFNTWVFCCLQLLLIPCVFLPRLSCPRILSLLLALGNWYHSRQCHAMPMFKRKLVIHVCSQYTFVAAATVLPKFLKFWAPPHDLELCFNRWILEPFGHALVLDDFED